MRLFETTCVISALCLCLVQQPRPTPPDDGPEHKPTTSPAVKASIQKIVDEMQGTWRLTSMDAPLLEKEHRTDVGYLLCAGSYFSFELHTGWVGPTDKVAKRLFQSGTHRFELDPLMRMTATSVIGSIVDPDGRVLFEQPGHKREYAVECLGRRLKLTRDDGTWFEFERMVDNRMMRDFYGRPIKPKEGEPGADGKDGKDAKDGKDGKDTSGGKDGKETPPKKD